MSDDVKRQLYNRQEYVVGAEAQKKYGQTDVLILGLSGTGCEIAKNLVLTGVRSVTLCDDAPVTLADLSSLFFASEEDVGKPRAATILNKVGELNRFVKVDVIGGFAATDIAVLEAWRRADPSGIKVVVFVDQATTKLVAHNEWARANNVKFVSCENRGISGCVFVDGGDDFTILDKNGEETVSLIVTGVTEDGVVMCHEDKKHECEPGDKVYFSGIVGPDVNSPPGSEHLRLFEVIDVMSPFFLKVRDDSGAFARGAKAFEAIGGYMHTTKQPKKVQFKSLREAITQPEMMFISDDDAKITAAYELHKIFQSVHSFMANSSTGGAPPSSAQEVGQVVAELTRGDEAIENVAFVTQVVSTFRGNLTAMACFVGGLASQEALKLCSGKFTPLMQWAYYDVREVLAHAGTDTAPLNCRYDGQIAVIGAAAQAAIQKSSGFIVGAGALGCEFIKNFAMMGIATSGDGAAVTITDMDTIEMSNLSRQFLFRTEHIGQPKSRVAAQAARRMNTKMTIVGKEEKVAQETVATFSSDFWEAQSFVCTALDNMQARKYVDEQCVFFKRPLFDSGTLGTKCSVQCVIPFVTESYSSSYDPPDTTIPICTLKNFPNAIEHTIQWARDHFYSLFTQQPRDANNYLRDASFLPSLDKEPGNKPLVFASLIAAIGRKPTSQEDCVAWARVKFEELFANNIKQLLHAFPKDKLNEKGERFWAGAKKPPTPTEFSPATEADHRTFILAAARLYGEVYGIPITLSADEQLRIAERVSVPTFQPKEIKFADNEKEKSDTAEAQLVGEISAADLPSREANAALSLHEVEFEKDDDGNGHMDFITATSNIRAAAYKIPTADKIRTKLIAGQIIPAMVTTTALVTGLVTFELLKYFLGERRREMFRNSYTNIALPLMTLTLPNKAPGSEHKKRDGSVVEWNMWSRIDVDEGRDITVRELVKVLERDHDIETSMITAENGKILFSEFNQKSEKVGMRVSAALESITGVPLPASQTHLCVVVTGMIADEDVDIPLVRYRFRF